MVQSDWLRVLQWAALLSLQQPQTPIHSVDSTVAQMKSPSGMALLVLVRQTMLVVVPAVPSYSAMYQRTAASSGSPTTQCDDADDILISGGCDCPQTQIWSSYPVNAVDSNSVSGWTCYAGNVNVTAYAICLTQ